MRRGDEGLSSVEYALLAAFIAAIAAAAIFALHGLVAQFFDLGSDAFS